MQSREILKYYSYRFHEELNHSESDSFELRGFRHLAKMPILLSEVLAEDTGHAGQFISLYLLGNS